MRVLVSSYSLPPYLVIHLRQYLQAFLSKDAKTQTQKKKYIHFSVNIHTNKNETGQQNVVIGTVSIYIGCAEV